MCSPKFFLLFTFLLSNGIIHSQILQKTQKKPKNVILLIGDGMGLSQVSVGQFYQDTPSNFDRFPVIGLIKTSADGYPTTDSAAAATAFATGYKTYNGAIGVDRDTIPIPNLVEQLSKEGYQTGIVVTSTVQHATPASFYAHVKSRYHYETITKDLISSELDFIAGGGSKYFSNRQDGLDLLTAIQDSGFQLHTEVLPEKTSKKKQAILLASDAMPAIKDGRGEFLSEASLLAMEQLSLSGKGYFLIVEGSQIDWGGHANDATYLIGEMLDFDKTLGTVLDYSEQLGDTLVIVTADHETGGFTLTIENGDYRILKPAFATKSHSATLIPVFAIGPGAENFGGIYENTEIYTKILDLLKE